MTRKITVMLFSLLCSLWLFSAFGQASVILGEVSGKMGENVQVPIMLSSNTDCVALLLRLEYDADYLIAGAVHNGPLMTLSHSIDSFSPEEGRINLIVFAYNQYVPFAEQDGIIAFLDFLIKLNAPEGTADIVLTEIGAPDLPVSELVDSEGNILTPEVFSGKVTVQAKTMATTWTLF